MSGISLSPEHGVNPTIPVCFWCGQEKNEVALLGRIGGKQGEDIAAPKNMVLDYTPCEKCKEIWDEGAPIIEVTTNPDDDRPPIMGDRHYPTGRIVVLTKEAAKRIFKPEAHAENGAFMAEESFAELFKNLETEEVD